MRLGSCDWLGRQYGCALNKGASSAMMSARTVTPGKWTLETIPRLLVECRVQAAAYGRCVSADATGKTELRKGACAKEFEELKQCISKAAKRSTR